METIWFALLSVMLAGYVVLDGFDFGAGMLHLYVARDDEERRTVLAAIGPVWDGNEVWLLAAGGVLVYAFPRVYAAGFSGFYLPLTMVLWLLVLRGLSIEFRSKEAHPLWRSFWDGAFAFSSTLMGVFLGAALGNVIRGVPLDGKGYFAGPLFTDFMTGPNPGVLDWYTVLVGVFATLVLAAHGSLYLVVKTGGALQQRAARLGSILWVLVLILMLPVTLATYVVRPELYLNLIARPWTWALAALVAGSLLTLFQAIHRQRERRAFIASCAYIASLLAATAAGYYPNLLASTLGPQHDLTVMNSATGALSLYIGLFWWSFAFALVIAYFAYLFWSFRGKVDLSKGSPY